jgi:hypothetical protein
MAFEVKNGALESETPAKTPAPKPVKETTDKKEDGE